MILNFSNVTPDATQIILISSVVEFAKIYLPDKLEPKILPIVSILTGALMGLAQGNIANGIVNGLSASGLYKIAMKVTGKISGNGE
jgi:hypothetical protein